MDATIDKRIERALDHADHVTSNENLTPEQRIHRREGFGRDFANTYADFRIRLKNGTLHELPSLSDAIDRWQKIADEVDDG
jgi:hypothetical protein